MSHSAEWQRLENLDAVATAHLGTWHRAMEMQADRVLDEHRSHLDRQIDSYQFVHALRQVHRAAAFVADAMDGDAKRLASRALDDFDELVPHAKDARDVLDHFDDYSRGVGNLSHPGVPRRDRTASEDASREFSIFYEARPGGHYVVHLGHRLQIDVATAREAADRLIDAILEAQGLVPADEDAALGSIPLGDHRSPLSVGFGFWVGLIQDDITDDIREALVSLVTPESVASWGDFQDAARYIEGWDLLTGIEQPHPKVAYMRFKPTAGSHGVLQVTRETMITESRWLTLVERDDLGGVWRIHAVADRPGPIDEVPFV